MKHSELPFRITGHCRESCGYKKCDVTWITGLSEIQGCGFSEEDAQFIVKACNNHYQLLSLLKEVTFQLNGAIEYLDDDLDEDELEPLRELCKEARAAIEEAK